MREIYIMIIKLRNLIIAIAPFKKTAKLKKKFAKDININIISNK